MMQHGTPRVKEKQLKSCHAQPTSAPRPFIYSQASAMSQTEKKIKKSRTEWKQIQRFS